MFYVFQSSYRNNRKSLGELEKAVETLTYGSCSHMIFRSPKLPLVFLKLNGNTVHVFYYIGCVSLRKSKIGFLNPKESENGFCVSLLNRLIQDLSDHGASKEPTNPLTVWILRFL